MANSKPARDSWIASRPASFSGRLPSISESIGELPNLATRQQRHSAPILPKLIVPGLTSLHLDGRLLQEYNICGKPYTMQQPPNEAIATFERNTVDGRRLSYRLKVVQQPQRARACGSGPRSDRRPVDPPPVVKLTIYDGQEDITLRYDAGFMLYASLDVARPIASGRMHAGQIVPVLTGVAVAGVAYLERPKQAGYFIFPDLSVRHEGWYRLRFHLFEQVKHSYDADQDRPFEKAQSSTSEQPLEPNQHEAMANRMYVYSAPFQVFSAKKFPGLNTSTELSKVVADQGCRVRIRREIRQRRKPKGKDDGEDEQHKSVHGTPEPSIRAMHERSLSREALSTKVSFEALQQQMVARRPSLEQLAPSPLIGPPLARQSISSPHINPYQQPRQMFRPENEVAAYTPISQSTMPAPSRTMTPNPEPTSRTLPSISQFLVDAPSSASPRPRAYNLPEPVQQKRSYSPRTYSQDAALKDGARPDMPRPQPPSTISAQRSMSTFGWVMNGEKTQTLSQPQPQTPISGQIIEADAADTYGDNSDSEDSLLDGPFIYRRADGTKSSKPLTTPSMRY